MSDNKQTLACVLICPTCKNSVFVCVCVCANIDSSPRFETFLPSKAIFTVAADNKQAIRKVKRQKKGKWPVVLKGRQERALITTPNNAPRKRELQVGRLDDNRWSVIAVGNEESPKRKH